MTEPDHSLDNPPPGHRVAQALTKIAMALRSHAWREGFARDLTPTQGQVLAFLDQRGGATLRQVAEALGVKDSTASEAVGVLERKGLLNKNRHPDDARRLALGLTPAGRQQAAHVATWPDFLVQVAAGLGAGEQAVLLRVLQLLIRELQQRGEIPFAQMCSTCRHFRPFAHVDPVAPHHCALAEMAFGDRDLRFDCPDHEPAVGAEAQAAWLRFATLPAG